MNPNKQEIKSRIRNPKCDEVLLGFSQNELKKNCTWITTKDYTVRAYAVIQIVYLHTNQSLTAPISKELQDSPQSTREGDGRNQEHKTSEFQKGCKI
jgi:hypothetical protein